MKASNLISSSIISLHPEDDGNRGIELMEDMRVHHLPIVRDNFYLGIISENEIMSWDNTDEFINEHLDELNSPSIKNSQHLFDIIEEVEKHSLSIIPVIDEKNYYLGSITNRKLLYTIAKSTAVQSKGSMVVLKIKENNYTLNEITRIVESNNTKILSSYITSSVGEEYIELTIKLNRLDISLILKDFERFDYIIKTSYSKDNDENDFLGRYESLMRFLNP
tara:strand:- start:2477 stop:3139 length:663 start_codon:yes stop_codon:yes gene_type:complete